MTKRVFCGAVALTLLAGHLASAADDLPRGTIVDDVACRKDSKQHYSLYLPSSFTPNRKWPVIFGFDAGGRGRRAVERYQEAAEKYGFIVAGSNNSRNGSWDVSVDAATAMSADVTTRFPIDPKRVYTAGMSGGARVALLVALESQSGSSPLSARNRVAGVLASSAGFPQEFHETVPFPIFGSAGTNDFNHQEMMELNRGLRSTHRLEIFEGTHEWLPVALATDGVEWMEIQAIRSGTRPKDAALVDQIFAKRVARAEAQQSPLAKMRELQSIATDFDGLKDVAAFAARAATLEKQFDVKKELSAERAAEDREVQVDDEIFRLRDNMRGPEDLQRLQARVRQLLAQSKAEQDSTDRQIARRVLTGFAASSRGVRNDAVQSLLNEIRPPGPIDPSPLTTPKGQP